MIFLKRVTDYRNLNKESINKKIRDIKSEIIICSICNTSMRKGSLSRHNERKHNKNVIEI